MQKRTLMLAAALGLSTFAFAGGAGVPDPAVQGPMSTAQMSNDSDILAMEVLTMSNLAEITTSQLALQKSQNAAVRQYAQMMITEHTAAQAQLNAIAARKGVKLTDKPGADQRLMYNRLSTLSGMTFDMQYVAVQIMGHDMTVKLIDMYLRIGNDADALNYARTIRPAVVMHLREAQALDKQMRMQ